MEWIYTGMIKRWGQLSDAEEFGTDPAFTASAICGLLMELAETGTARRLTTEQERLLLGFEVNTGYGPEDGFSFVHCLDLHSVSLDPNWKTAIMSELDHYFMEEIQVNGITFWERYREYLRK